MDTASRTYCERLGLAPSAVEAVLERPDLRLFQLVVAVLLRHGRPMILAELAAAVADLGHVPAGGDLAHSIIKAWHGRKPVCRDDKGRFGLDLSSPALERYLWTARLRKARGGTPPEVVLAERGDEQEGAGWRHGILRVVPAPAAPAAAALLHLGKRTILTFTREQMAALPRALGTFRLLAGLSIRDTLWHLGLCPDDFRLIELDPRQKALRPNLRGETLPITPELLIASTTGISHPLADPEKVAQYLARGEDRKLRRRLERDLKSIYAFYQHGILHRGVRLRWGFVDEHLPLAWDFRGLPSLWEILERARSGKRAVDIVIGAVPGWKEPWARARRVVVLGEQMGTLRVREGQQVFLLHRDEIQAIRLAPERAPASSETAAP